MAADTFDSILGLLLMGIGNDNNTWGTNANNSDFVPIAQAIAGVNTISATSGTVDLSGSPPPTSLRQDICHIQILNGALTGDLTIIVPNISKRTMFINNTTGAFNVFVKVPSGASPTGLRQIPQNHKVDIIADGNGNLFRGDGDQIGRLIHHAGTAAPGGALICNGASLLRSEYPDLFNVIGTTWGSADSSHFTVPFLTDTNRYLRAGGGSGPAVGTYQSNQNQAHTHTVTGAPSAGTLGTDSQGAHTHGATSTDSGHVHGYSQFSAGAGTVGGGGSFGGNIGANTASSTANITTTIGSAGAHTHNITGAPGIGSLGTASQGGTEARHESAAVLICIRY